MKISIITPTLDQARFIEDTILSVKNQNYGDFEHIVIDGGSTDGTIDILKKYPHLKWVSEKDTGQSNAINKGFRMASGDILAWLNSDDYYDRNIFQDIADYFQNHPDCFFLYGDITYTDEAKNPTGRVAGKTISFRKLLNNPDLVRQPSSFWRKEVVQSVGELNEDLHLVMDYDFFLRVGKKHQFHYINRNLSFFRSYPLGKTYSLAGRQAVEIKSVMKAHARLVNLRYYIFMALRRYGAFVDFVKNKFRE